MSMSDPIADLLTRVRNALGAGHNKVEVPASKIKEQLCRVLCEEGYLTAYTRREDAKQGMLEITLKYLPSGKPVIKDLKRVSKPSLRLYKKRKDIRDIRTGLGVAIMTTSKGVMTGKKARLAKIGGEVLCEVW